MKTIGLLGGMSWESTLTYYQIINMVTAQTLGGLHSARCLLYSVDFDEIERCQQAGDNAFDEMFHRVLLSFCWKLRLRGGWDIRRCQRRKKQISAK